MRSFLSFLLVLLLLGAAAVSVGGYFAHREVHRPGPHTEDTVVLLKSGSSVSMIAEELKSSGVLRHPELFIVVTRLTGVGGDLKAGEFQIPAGASAMELIELIVNGKSILHYVTIPEGLTTAQALRIIAEDPILEGEITLSPAEGTLLPETYAFTRSQTRDQIINSMVEAQTTFVDSVWDNRALELPYTTRSEAIILASIVEKETAQPNERGRIASVFVNRLRKNMRLESDPTVIYGLTQGEPLGRGLRASELKKSTTYNTYRIFGLPPTPISNPGKDAILAVLNPDETDDIFFVANGEGGHAFASTLSQHNRNVATWRRIERERRAQTQE
ncbi:MAG: endolytic transglycosylase MltG [Pseudomonadota bacterium]